MPTLNCDVTFSATWPAASDLNLLDREMLAAYAAEATAQQRAVAARDELGSGTLTVVIRDGGALKFAGTFEGPMVAGADGSLGWSGDLTGVVAEGGTPNAATWTCMIRNANCTRMIFGSFGPGGRFTFSGDALVAGAPLRLRVLMTPPV